LPLAAEIVRYLVTGKGMLTYSASLVAASVKVLEESATPDVQCSFAPGSFKDGQIGQLEEEPGLTGGSWQMRPLSRGYVEAKSTRPAGRGDQPALSFGGGRPARGNRGFAVCAPHFRGAGFGAL
jgi:choline dehydrogenase